MLHEYTLGVCYCERVVIRCLGRHSRERVKSPIAVWAAGRSVKRRPEKCSCATTRMVNPVIDWLIDEFGTLIVVNVGRKGLWWMLKKKVRGVGVRFWRLEVMVDCHRKHGRVMKMVLCDYFLTFSSEKDNQSEHLSPDAWTGNEMH